MKTHKQNKELTPYQIKLIKAMKHYREARGYTQKELSEGMKASQTYISLIESLIINRILISYNCYYTCFKAKVTRNSYFLVIAKRVF